MTATFGVWDVGIWECMSVIRGKEIQLISVGATKDGNVMVPTRSGDKNLVWNIGSGECMRVFRGHGSRLTLVEVREDKKLIVSWDRTPRFVHGKWRVGAARMQYVGTRVR